MLSALYPRHTILKMRNPQFASVVWFGVAMVLFLFSLALVPPVEMYCRFERPAIVLLIVQLVLLAVRIARRESSGAQVLTAASVVFIALGVGLNTLLLVMARGRC